MLLESCGDSSVWWWFLVVVPGTWWWFLVPGGGGGSKNRIGIFPKGLKKIKTDDCCVYIIVVWARFDFWFDFLLLLVIITGREGNIQYLVVEGSFGIKFAIHSNNKKVRMIII